MQLICEIFKGYVLYEIDYSKSWNLYEIEDIYLVCESLFDYMLNINTYDVKEFILLFLMM